MANTQIRNLLTEINTLLQRPPQMANGADQVLASEEWQYREQLKQLRSRLETMTDDSQIEHLEQKFRALIHQLQPFQVLNYPDSSSDASDSIPVTALPAVPPLPPLKKNQDISRPMPLPPLAPVGSLTNPHHEAGDRQPKSHQAQGDLSNELPTDQKTDQTKNNAPLKDDFEPDSRESLDPEPVPQAMPQPMPLPPHFQAQFNTAAKNITTPQPVVRHTDVVIAPAKAATLISAPKPISPDPGTDAVVDLGSNAANLEHDLDHDLVTGADDAEDITADLDQPAPSVSQIAIPQATDIPTAQSLDRSLDRSLEQGSDPALAQVLPQQNLSQSLEPQLLSLLERVVEKTVQQAVRQSLDTERAVILNEISQTIAQNIGPNHENSAISGGSNPYYERLEEEIANLKLQKELLNQEISRLATAQESWSSQVAAMQAQQKEGLPESLQSVVQEAVQSAVQNTLEQTIEQALQSKSHSNSNLNHNSDLNPPDQSTYGAASESNQSNETLAPIAPELVSQIQQQTDRFLLNLDAMFNATFQNLEHDLEGYKAAFEKKLSYIEQLEHRGEALLDSLLSRADLGESNISNANKTSVAGSTGTEYHNPDYNHPDYGVDLPPEIDPSYLSPVQEYVDESLIQRLLSAEDETMAVDHPEYDDQIVAQSLSGDFADVTNQSTDQSTETQAPLPSAPVVENQWNVIDSAVDEDLEAASAPTELAVVADFADAVYAVTNLNPELDPELDRAVPHSNSEDDKQDNKLDASQEINTIEDLLTLFPEDELFAEPDGGLTDNLNLDLDTPELEQWEEIYADDVTIAANVPPYLGSGLEPSAPDYQFPEFTDPNVDPILDLTVPGQPEIDLERDVLTHLSDLAQMLEEVENTSTIVHTPSADFDPNLDGLAELTASPLEDQSLNLTSSVQESVAPIADLANSDTLNQLNNLENLNLENLFEDKDLFDNEDDATLIAPLMVNLPPLPPMSKVSPHKLQPEQEPDPDPLRKFDIPTAGDMLFPADNLDDALNSLSSNAATGSQGTTPPLTELTITELKIPNLTEVTADDELLSWLNENPLPAPRESDTDDLLSHAINSESVTIIDEHKKNDKNNINHLQPLPLPVLPNLNPVNPVPETVPATVTQSDAMPDLDLGLDIDLETNQSEVPAKDADDSSFDIEGLGNEEESLILLPNHQGTERQEVLPWDDSLVRQLAEDLSSLEEGSGANPLVATNIDQVIRNTPFRHTQPSSSVPKVEPSPESIQSTPPAAPRPSWSAPSVPDLGVIGLPVADKDDPDQLFAAVIAEQIASRSLNDDTTEAIDELDALLSGKTKSITAPSSRHPSSNVGTLPADSVLNQSDSNQPPRQQNSYHHANHDGESSPFDGDTSQLFHNLEADVADLFPDSLTKSDPVAVELDYGVVFHDLTSDLDDLSEELRGGSSSHSSQNMEKLLELADLDDEATYIITDDASTILEPHLESHLELQLEPRLELTSESDHSQATNHAEIQYELEGEQTVLVSDADASSVVNDDLNRVADAIDFDDVLKALDAIEQIDSHNNQTFPNQAVPSQAATNSVNPNSVNEDDSWQRELDEIANLGSHSSGSLYHNPVAEEEEPLSSADFFAALERESAEAEAAAQLNAFANRAERLSTPSLQRPRTDLDLELAEIIDPIDPMEQRLTALADATERGEAEDKLWESLFDEIERPNFKEPLLSIEREKLGLSATATDRQGALDISAETLESRSQALVPPPPEREVYGLHDQWILGIDVGTYHIRASLCNGSSGKFYPLSFKPESTSQNLEPNMPEGLSSDSITDSFRFMASYTGELTLQDPLTEPIAIARTLDELPASGYPLTNWKALFNLGLPYKSITSWQPVVQWSDQHQVPLRWLIAATVNALKQLPQIVHHPRLPDLAAIFQHLQGVVVAQPSAEADTFGLNIREAVLAAGLVANPEQVMVVEQSIAPLLRQVQLHQRQTETPPSEGISLFLDGGATGTSVGLLKGNPSAPTKHDLCHRHWDYGGNSLDQDIVLQLLYPHWRMVSNPDRHQCDLSDLHLPTPGSIVIAERAMLGQRLRSSAVGLALLDQAKTLKEALTNDPTQERWQVEVHGLPLVVLRRELESLVFQPYIQQINRELNTLLSLSGIFGADITKVYLVGGAWQFPLVLRWLQQKLPNAQIENLAITAIAEGLSVAPLHPHLLNLVRQQYSDYFLLREICQLQLSAAVNPNSLLHQLQLQGINIKACRDRILTILQGDFPRGLFPWQEPEGCLVQNDPSLQGELFSGNLFELNSDGTYQPNVVKFQQLRAYLEVILCNMRQTLTEPMVFPPLTTPADSP